MHQVYHGGVLSMRAWHQMQVAGTQSRRPSGSPEPRRNRWRVAEDWATTPPARQRIMQQPTEVGALGMPVPQHTQEPAVGYPNNIVYPGQRVGITDAWSQDFGHRFVGNALRGLPLDSGLP